MCPLLRASPRELPDAMSMIDSFPQAGVGLLNWITGIRTVRNAQADAAVRAVLVAANATTAYIVDWENGNRDREKEHELVRLWSEAAAAIRHHDRDFAFKLDMKARYWADPDTWNEDDVKRAGIALKDVAARARSLLGGGI